MNRIWRTTGLFSYKIGSLFCAALVGITLMALPSSAAAEDAHRSQTLTVLNYETGWTHDGAGYHPAVFMLLENTSGRDLTSTTIKFQARFTDLETTEVTVGRKSVRRTFKPMQQVNIGIVGRESSNGMEGFELPFEVNYWPKLETKVMCRVGDSGDEGTETLLITKLDPETRAEDEAFDHLNQTTSYNGPHHRPVAAAHTTRPKPAEPVKVEKPPAATAERVGSKPAAAVHPASNGDASSAMSLLNSKSLPGLGDDFFNFEQRFGLPITTDATKSDWTWAKYRHGGSGTEILAGSKARHAKVDLIVMRIPRGQATDQNSLVLAAKQLGGHYHSQTLTTPTHSVRYLPSGRIEVATSNGVGYRVVCMNVPDSDNSYFLVVSRLPQDVEPLLAGLARKTSLLKQFQFLDNKDPN
jgi:hypothetical protein